MKRVFAALNIQIFVCLLVSFMLLLCGCNRSETSSDAPASSAPETVQTTQAPVKRAKRSPRRKNWKNWLRCRRLHSARFAAGQIFR